MAKTNKEIVAEYYELVFNQKRLDLYETYVSPDWVNHSQPFVGIGIWYDTDMEPGKVMVRGIAPGSPADGVLQVRDEILSVTDGDETYYPNEGLNSITDTRPRVIGTTVEYLVRREGQEHRFQLQRGIVPGIDYHWKKEDMESYFRDASPDMCSKIQMAVEEGDLVAIYEVNSGTWMETGTPVVFAGFNIYRLKDGKIIESWGLIDEAGRMRQEGYQMVLPAKKPST